jgi:hypothetical protein
MRFAIENPNNQPIVPGRKLETTKTDLTEINQFSIPKDPYRLKKFEYDQLLQNARKDVLENPELLGTILQAVKAKTQNKRVDDFAKVENILIEKCISLTESDIDNLIRQLGKKFLEFLRSTNRINEVTGQIRDDLITGRFNIDSRGIISTINFIRARINLLTKNPAQNFVIGFNNLLDANYKIDLVELIFGKTQNDIEQLNLIQIKSSVPHPEETKLITGTHRYFLRENVLHLVDPEHPEFIIKVKVIHSIVAVGSKITSQTKIWDDTI